MSIFRRIEARRIEKLWARWVEPDALRVLSHAVALAPRLIVHVASIAVLAGLVNACVPATRYEEAKSASEVALAARQRAEVALRATQEQLDALATQLDQRERQLAESEQSISETKLENSVATKERDEASGLVDQLRGDLGRVGDNLRSYAKEKADLETSLQVANARKLDLEKSEANTVAVARLMRDLSAALGERVIAGDVSLDVQDTRVVLSAASDFWFDDSSALRPSTDPVLAALSRLLSAHTESSAMLRVPGPAADKRGSALLLALEKRGVSAARLTLMAPPLPEAGREASSSATSLAAGPTPSGLAPPASTSVVISFSVG